MAGEEFLLEPPYRAHPIVPQLQLAVAGEHRQRLEQIVERRGPHPQQCVARGGELHLLGPILENDQQTPIGQRLRDHAQMRAPGQMPVFLRRILTRYEPGTPLRLPRREVANLGQAVRLAHPLQHPIEFGSIGQPFGAHREHAAERLIAEDEAAVRAELRNASGQAVEHRALRLGEALGPGPRLLQILDIDREARNTARR